MLFIKYAWINVLYYVPYVMYRNVGSLFDLGKAGSFADVQIIKTGIKAFPC